MEPVLWTAVTSFFVAGAAWGAVKTGLNGTREKIGELHQRLSKHIDEETSADLTTHERLTRVETKVDTLIERIK